MTKDIELRSDCCHHILVANKTFSKFPECLLGNLNNLYLISSLWKTAFDSNFLLHSGTDSALKN